MPQHSTAHPNPHQGFTLVELLITTALSALLLLSLTGFFGNLIRSYRIQADSQMLYHQAVLISTLWQNDLSHAAELGCLSFDQPAQISHDHTDELRTRSGIAVYQVDFDLLPTILTKTIQKKLLPHSIVVVTEGSQAPTKVAVYEPQSKQFYLNQPIFQNNDLVLLSSCRHAWLFHWSTAGSHHFTPPANIGEPSIPYRVALWHSTLWFAMRDNQNHYGVYRLMLPSETTPVELISDVSALQANVWIDNQMVPANSDTNWNQVNSIQLILTLEKNHLQVFWPTSIALLRKTLGINNP
jgi:hypothetical protein